MMKTLLLPLLLASPAWAETHQVRMLNRGETGAMVYEPAYLNIAPGDTVEFVPVQPTHNAATIAGMIPPGATPFRSRINQPFQVVLTEPGLYGVKCTPHYAMGMVMLIEVGPPAPTVELPPDLPERAARRLRAIALARD